MGAAQQLLHQEEKTATLGLQAEATLTEGERDCDTDRRLLGLKAPAFTNVALGDSLPCGMGKASTRGTLSLET